MICTFSVYIIANRVEMKFLHYMCGCWEFSKIEDTKIIDAKYLFMGPCATSDITKRGTNLKKTMWPWLSTRPSK